MALSTRGYGIIFRGAPRTVLTMESLVFLGNIKTGVGRYKSLTFPTRQDIPSIPHDWPDQLYRGSLNVAITDDAYPKKFHELGTLPGIKRLDGGKFAPAFVIPHSFIKGNLLVPSLAYPNRGDAQIWRANLSDPSKTFSESCWLVRRIGSDLVSDLELVSDKHLRSYLHLNDGMPVRVEVQGAWRK